MQDGISKDEETITIDENTSCAEFYFPTLDPNEKQFILDFSGGLDRNGDDIFVGDKLSIIGSSTIYVVEFDKVNLRYLGRSSNGCTLLGCQFDIAKVEGG